MSRERILAEQVVPIAREVKSLMEGVPPSHGYRHNMMVAEYATYLALSESLDPKTAQLTALLHDLRWEEGEERQVRGIQLTGLKDREKEVTRGIILDLFSQEDINGPLVVGNMMRAIVRHGKLPEDLRQPSPLMNVTADADRLSRMGYHGLISILEANQNYDEPFYNEGGEIIRPKNAPLLPNSEINSCIDDVNACLGWTQIMQTPTGQSLATTLGRVNRAFLETFSAFSHVDDYGLWIDYLRTIYYQTYLYREPWEALEDGNARRYRELLVQAEDPSLITPASFQEFLNSRQLV